MESFKANICIFFGTSSNVIQLEKNIFIGNDELLKKLLYSIYIALKGDSNTSPDFDTRVNVSVMNNSSISLTISSNNISKFRASILSFLRLTDLAYSIIQINI